MAEYVWVDADGGTRSKSRVSANFTIAISQCSPIAPSLPVEIAFPSRVEMHGAPARRVGWAVLYAGKEGTKEDAVPDISETIDISHRDTAKIKS
jgi:hypothetical protein